MENTRWKLSIFHYFVPRKISINNTETAECARQYSEFSGCVFIFVVLDRVEMRVRWNMCCYLRKIMKIMNNIEIYEYGEKRKNRKAIKS